MDGFQEGRKHDRMSDETKLSITGIADRIEDLLRTISDQHIENKEAHKEIIERLNYTNGKVRGLQIWKAGIVGAVTVIGLIASYMINDYLRSKEMLIVHEKNDAVMEQKISVLERIEKINVP